MEKAYEKSKQGLWHRLWYRMGDEKEIVSAWLDLIPSEYGLSVIKAGIAVVFKVSRLYPTDLSVSDAIDLFLCSLVGRKLQRQEAESFLNFLNPSRGLG